ncbi:hypothetical protein FB45DRAFT_361343 [Roridomyces roridus]|uniref:Uncharacterized protein n=1 Tax=Roridomyces roridus TaxID=1738132 RepID=A0AAD7C8R5_9AGAR|nr:hypothetical protein FB45DRAFT_361343 [Roridomyces roridus]
MFLAALLLASSAVASVRAAFPEGVIATGTQGATNPPVATMGTVIDQTSIARLISVNSIDDFCVYAPAEPNTKVSDVEGEVVAWCTMPRNNARVIPDGVITGVTFLKTDFYVQIMGWGDFTKLTVANGDSGGELDPHGATGVGNPVGGNVTTTVADGLDEPIEEWMMYMSASQFCLRACTNANSTYAAKYMCWHELDVMGCEFVMPGTYHEPGTFESCDADVAYPPGWYPTATVNGQVQFSTFAQYFEGVYTGGNGLPTAYTVGTTVTPDAPYTIPSSSNCVTTSTIGNGIDASLLTAGAKGSTPLPGFTSTPATAASAPGSSATGSAPVTAGGSPSGSLSTQKITSSSAKSTPSSAGSGSASASGSGSNTTGSSAAFRGASIAYGHGGEYAGITIVSIVSALAAIALLH